MLAFMCLQASLILASLLLHWHYQHKSPQQRRMLQIQSAGIGSPRGDWWEKQKLSPVLRAAWVRCRLMSRKGQIVWSGNPGSWSPPGTALLVCICLLDWESTGLLLPCSFQRADQGPGAEHWPCLLSAVTADRQGLLRWGKKVKQSNRLPKHSLYCSGLII